MSGILGYWNLDDRPIDPAIVSRMSSALRHRGPDGEGRRTAGAVAFVQQHLWITPEEVDESLPMVSAAGCVARPRWPHRQPRRDHRRARTAARYERRPMRPRGIREVG